MVICLVTSELFAQKQYKYGEIGCSFEPSAYFGDLTANNRIGSLRFGCGTSFSFKLNSYLSLGTSIGHRSIAGADSLNRTELINRNLSFKTSLTNLDVYFKVDILQLDFRSRYGNYSSKPLEINFLFGMSFFHFNPKGYDLITNSWVNLRPLGTEGQTLSEKGIYSSFGIGLLSGVNMKFDVANNLSIGLGLNVVKTFTDYLDDVSGSYANYNDLNISNPASARMADKHLSDNGAIWTPYQEGVQRGNSKNDDWFYYLNIGVYRKLKWK